MVYQMLAGITPWQSDSDYDLYESIKNKPVEFPDEFDPVARDLVSKLLDKDPNTRLGSGSEDRYTVIIQQKRILGTQSSSLLQGHRLGQLA
jgi:3-phosphoinositide dependent protein kinase-1